MDLPKLHRERAVDAVYAVLRQAIVSHGMKPGERLNVDELAAQLGVSLTPVRGAIQQLATEGLVEIRPRSGTFVASLTAQDLDETFRIRCALECLAVEDAVHNIDVGGLRKLRDLLKTLRKPVKSDDDRQMHERANLELHQVILDASGNRRLQEMYSALNAHIKIARIHASESGWATRLQDEQLEHEEIVAGLEARDAARTVKAMRKHVYRAKDDLLAALEEPANAE
ncbi:MAG: GntR family transcriptional regulator [Candidatus Solibacter usitatus]|nr:GntR family transcriptional regulator [Candidatus Solibacter usitatus]